METLNNQYSARKEDINAYYDILEFIDSIETYKHDTIKCLNTELTICISPSMQKCMRACCVILLYNIIESTIVLCIQSLYDEIEDQGLTYKELSDELKSVWIKSQYPHNMGVKGVHVRTRKIMDEIESLSIKFGSNLHGDISGNLDMRKVKDIAITLGIDLELQSLCDKEKIADTLLRIKNRRNILAHGESAFSNIGSQLTLNELRKYKDHVYIFLERVIEKFEEFIKNKKHLTGNRS